MGKLYGLDGKELTSQSTSVPLEGRIRPEIPMDTPEGNFIVPVVLLAAGQYAQLVKDVAQAVADILCPEQIELPFEEVKPPTTDPESAILTQ